MQKQIKNFLDFIENDKKASQNTLQSYKRDIMQYSDYVEENKINYLRVNEDDIREYLKHMNEIGKKSSTISRSLASIRSFYQYLLRVKKVKRDPTEGIQSPKIERRVPSVLTSQEVELLLEQPKNVDLKGIRDKAMLEFAYATG
ncbi:MAG: site-specific integrase, partial [Clostridia bacterium]|nr:site-specific integrase [Clostridia bacterium]